MLNDQKWPEMFQNDLKWLKTILNAQKDTNDLNEQSDVNDQKWQKMTKSNQKWPKAIKNDQKQPKNDSK